MNVKCIVIGAGCFEFEWLCSMFCIMTLCAILSWIGLIRECWDLQKWRASTRMIGWGVKFWYFGISSKLWRQDQESLMRSPRRRRGLIESGSMQTHLKIASDDAFFPWRDLWRCQEWKCCTFWSLAFLCGRASLLIVSGWKVMKTASTYSWVLFASKQRNLEWYLVCCHCSCGALILRIFVSWLIDDDEV